LHGKQNGYEPGYNRNREGNSSFSFSAQSHYRPSQAQRKSSTVTDFGQHLKAIHLPHLMYFFIGAKKQTRRLASRALHANCASLLVGKDRSARARQSPIESAALEVHDCAVGSVLV
jgi:hypothetical protein